MDTILDPFLNVIVSSLVGGLVSATFAWLKSRKAMDDGLRALLWREIKEIHSEAINRGGMSIDDRRHLESVYAAYHGRGGNGTGTRLFDEAMNQPVLD